jgi:inosose dehydratase
MAFKVGCFALIDPFNLLEHQVERIAGMGFRYADVTDNSDGACLGTEFGFTALASLDANPHDLKRLFEGKGVTITSYCAHANLLDPAAPWRYGTAQIIKAVRAAAAIGVKHVITTEGDAKTEFGHNLSDDEAIFTIREKLHEPLRVAEDFGVKILLEPHGKYTDSLTHVERILDVCDSSALGLNLDTGNLWLGGGEPVEFVQKFGDKIEHVHWKDMPKEMEGDRGKMYGCGMATIPLGTGVVDIAGTVDALKAKGFDGYTTLEIAGDDAVKQSYEFLKQHGAE